MVQRIKSQAPKRTKKYKQISKLQAVVKGWLFRTKVKKAQA